MIGKRGVFRKVLRVMEDVAFYYIGMDQLWKFSALISVVIFLHIVLGVSLLVCWTAAFFIYVLTGGWRFVKVVALTLPRDCFGLTVLVRLLFMVRTMTNNHITVPKLFDEKAKKHPKKPCVLFQDQVWTFEDLQAYSNRVANFLHNEGYKKGDVISIFAENCPEYIGLWMGMSKIGAIGALINFNLRDLSLAHCIKVANSKAIIVADSLMDALCLVRPSLPNDTPLYVMGKSNGEKAPKVISLDQAIERSPSYDPPTIMATCKDPLFYVYTSGTTGLPKAAVVTHVRYCYMAYGVTCFFRIGPKDVLYIPLPLYHTAGGILGTGQMVVSGTTLAIRTKFSASQFWTDCVKYKCTLAQYIGEICRYLLAQPVRPEEQQHSVRLVFGNGIKPQIWTQFQDRFKVKTIGEFYGSTEGNCSVVNYQNKVGAVGFTTRIAPILYPITLVKVDPGTGQVLRDSNGVCILAKPGEPGELVGKIVKGNASRDFDGYVDDNATQKKILHSVFKRGDMAFSTGDILVMDELGYMYFRDRTGDTFRWRGENVSTSEVEAVISNIIRLNDAVVYGVEVPGNEGRAGMAAIVDETGNVDLDKLNSALSMSLPAYARPIFIRFIKQADTTGTFKLKKVDLKKEGFDINKVVDPLFYLNPRTKKYELLTPEVYQAINECTIRL